MNITKMKLTIVGICGVLLLPFASHASSATLLNDNTVLFTIDFSFTDGLFAVQVPIAAEYGATYNDRIDTVGYTIVTNDSEMPEIAKINALVLSTASIEENKYSLQKGETGNFTLVILATFAEKITSQQMAYITKLPYWIDGRRTTTHQNQLDELDTAELSISE